VTPPVTQPGLPIGTPAPEFRLDGVYGEAQTLDSLRASGKPVLLLFSAPTCGPCTALMPEIGQWQREYADQLTIAIIGQGEPAANRAKTAEHGLTNVLLQETNEVSQLYEAKGTPTGVLIKDDGTIGSAVAPGADAIRALVKRAAFMAPVRLPVEAANIGNSAALGSNGALHGSDDMPVEIEEPDVESKPELSLPDLEGNIVTLDDFAGDPTAVLFWNPGCGYCKRMLDDLKAWEANPPEGAPRLLVVSTGTVEANQAQGIRSPLVLDDGFATGRTFGVSGTPSAVLLDGDGLVAGAPAVGSPRVMAILNGEELVPEQPATPPVVLNVGDEAPPIELPDLDGVTVSLSDFAGKPTLVMFWSPGCVFCQRMVDDLRALEAAPPVDAPSLLIVSSGEIEANRAASLQSTMLIDNGFATGRSFGASGTPSAILVDAEGKISAPLVVGAPKILAAMGYVSATCKECLENCNEQGGGEACRAVCEMGGQCP
jgi:thiol-disulfide isomerase/thioredoxin